MSATVAAVAALGPGFDAMMVYVTEPPRVAVVTPSVLVIARSALRVLVTVQATLSPPRRAVERTAPEALATTAPAPPPARHSIAVM
jgi:hypothetical protein